MSTPAAAHRLVCFLGNPAAGKGSYMKLLSAACERSGVPAKCVHTSALLKTDPAARELIRQGRLCGDDTALAVVRTELDRVLPAGSPPTVVMLDGLPRTAQQAVRLAGEVLPGRTLACVALHLQPDWAVAKARGRLVCPHCTHPYNDAVVDVGPGRQPWAADMPPRAKCDRVACHAGGEFPSLLQRRESEELLWKRQADYSAVEALAVEELASSLPAERFSRIEVQGGYDAMWRQVTHAFSRVAGVHLDEAVVEGLCREWHLF